MYDSLKPEIAPTVFSLTGRAGDAGWFESSNVGELAALLRDVADRLERVDHIQYGLCGVADGDEFTLTWGFDAGD